MSAPRADTGELVTVLVLLRQMFSEPHTLDVHAALAGRDELQVADLLAAQMRLLVGIVAACDDDAEAWIDDSLFNLLTQEGLT